MCYFFDDIINIEEFNNILLGAKSYQNILTYNFPYKTLFVQNHCVLACIKQMDLLEFMMDLDIQYYLVLKNLSFAIRLHIL